LVWAIGFTAAVGAHRRVRGLHKSEWLKDVTLLVAARRDPTAAEHWHECDSIAPSSIRSSTERCRQVKLKS
jgi:hypothetical protein